MPRRRADFRKILQTLTAANVDRTLAAMSEETRRRFLRDVQSANDETFERFRVTGWLDRHPEFRGRGDEGLAVDMMELADEEIYPRVDFGELVDLIIAAEKATTEEKRTELLLQAYEMASGNPAATSLVDRAAKRES